VTCIGGDGVECQYDNLCWADSAGYDTATECTQVQTSAAAGTGSCLVTAAAAAVAAGALRLM